jgi:hypothetical protein
MEIGTFPPFFPGKVELRLKSRLCESKFYKYEERPGPIARRRLLPRRILAPYFPVFLRGRS